MPLVYARAALVSDAPVAAAAETRAFAGGGGVFRISAELTSTAAELTSTVGGLGCMRRDMLSWATRHVAELVG